MRLEHKIAYNLLTGVAPCQRSGFFCRFTVQDAADPAKAVASCVAALVGAVADHSCKQVFDVNVGKLLADLTVKKSVFGDERSDVLIAQIYNLVIIRQKFLGKRV